jgi:hypothetical protein
LLVTIRVRTAALLRGVVLFASLVWLLLFFVPVSIRLVLILSSTAKVFFFRHKYPPRELKIEPEMQKLKLVLIVINCSPSYRTSSQNWNTILPDNPKSMPKRALKIIKLTPIALSMCEYCEAQFQSHQPIEQDAETEMRISFEKHKCSDFKLPYRQ